MKVILATKAGFCFGVRRALDMAEKMISENTGAASLGPLIHNRQVVESLSKKGIDVINDISEAKMGQSIIIRSHGVPPSVYEEAVTKVITVIDATCPFVQKAQHLAAEAAKCGDVVVVGDKNHPEVQGILGWAGPRAIAIETLEEAKGLLFFDRLAVLAQTTLSEAKFEQIIEELRLHSKNLTVYNTICHATGIRQKAADELASLVDVMVVAGGKNSANTRKLAMICSEKAPTFLVETADELQQVWFKDAQVAGLAAGASTPDWIIEEVFKKMSEMNGQDSMNPVMPEGLEAGEINMENWENAFQSLHRGSIVDGIVVKITNDEIFLDIGWKSEGVVSARELTSSRVERVDNVVAIGDKLKAMVLKLENEEGYPVLSVRRVKELEAVDKLQEIFENKGEIQAEVTEIVKGGVLVDLGMRGFVPASQLQTGYVDDLNQFLGTTLRLRIIEFDPARKKVVLSQKVVLQEEQAVKREQLLATIQEGDRITGTVRRLTNFGAFVDLGGVDGLLHISDLAYSRIKHPSEVVQIGDEVEVQVLKIDKDKAKISLGLKQLKTNPWDGVAEKYPIGAIISGKVVRIAPFGAFVQIEDGVDALVHISQLADRRVAKVEEVVNVGDMISAKVIENKPEEKRISLSIREAVKESQTETETDAEDEQ